MNCSPEQLDVIGKLRKGPRIQEICKVGRREREIAESRH